MTSHDVRNLRYCKTCERLAHSGEFLSDELCIDCAFEQAGGLVGFMKKYKRAAWEKLPLRLIGVDGMRTLLAKIEGE
jgi:hypothetical protein